MDDKGFIFTADAVLGLVVVFILTASIVTYAMLPIYQGEDHQHLEAQADSALEVMEQTGTLRAATVLYSNNKTTEAQNNLTAALNLLIPPGIGYKITVGDNPPVSDNRGVLTSNDVITKVKVISGPQEGWMGRSYYKLEKVNFTTETTTTVTTVWNFHNYLTNFQPWSGSNHLGTFQYWGATSGGSAQDITFSIPTTGTINSVQVLSGSTFETGSGHGTAHATNTSFYLNGILRDTIDPNEFQFLFNNPDSNRNFYNNKTNYNPALFNAGNNTFHLKFNSASTYNNMPWFSILANYTTSIDVPGGITFNSFRATDIAGVGNPTGATNNHTELLYNLDNGAITYPPGRSIAWTNLNHTDVDLSTPFEITGIPGGVDGHTSAVGTTMDVYIPNNTRLFDAYTVVNAFGAVDGCLVQVKDPSGNWQTVFQSFNAAGHDTFTERTDGGYGNLPGIISLHDTFNSSRDYLRAGHNTVRVIVWDDVPGNDYDLVGLENVYTSVAYSSLPIRWDTTTFNSFQDASGTTSKSCVEAKNFNIDPGAENALLFMGTGLDTRTVNVTVSNGTASRTIYNSNVQFVLNLTNYDTTNIFSYVNATGSRVPKTGNYTMTIKVTPALAYESGDLASSTGSYGYMADAELYSGTRIAVLYPQFLDNAWATAFASTPDAAKNASVAALIEHLGTLGITNPDQSLIKSEALYSGDVPNAIPIRLELWKY